MRPDEDPIAKADALIAEGRADEAAAYLQSLLSAGRGGLLLRSALVRALIAAGRKENAVASARESASLDPGVAIAAVTLGEALLAMGYLPAAIGEFQRALRLDPDSVAARFQLGCAWLEAGEAEKALEAFDAIEEGDAATAHKIAEAQAMRVRTRSDPRYVRHLFDQFSAEYETRMLDHLGYGAPEILRGLADLVVPDRSRKYSILDLGCGTGLGGAAFEDMASRLDGIDLSPSMIEKARARGIYDSLHVADLETALAESDATYDLVIAADTLVYLGDLTQVFAGTYRALLPQGSFLFTVEKKDGEGFELGPKRRWRHSDAYLRKEFPRADFELAGILDCHPRTEAGVPVEGFAVALRKT